MAFADDKAALQATIDTLTTEAQAYLDQLQAVTDVSFSDNFNIDSLLPVNIGWDAVPVIDVADGAPTFTPSLADITGTIPSPPTAPTLEFPTSVESGVPDFSDIAPVLAFPTAPDSGLPDAPAAAPLFVEPVIPQSPVFTLPAVPTFAALNVPEPPSISLPTFTAALPTDDLTAPTARFAFHEATYESVLLDPLKAKLLADLSDGGYGIETADEIALFNRTRDREIEAMMSRIDDAGRSMAARGFPLPPGELAVHTDRAYQEMQDKVSSASREITLARSKLYVENRQFTIREIRDLESVLINFHSAVQERALNTARLTVEMSVVIFKALVDRYNARAGMYRVQAEVFADRIRAQLAQAEIYRTQIEAANLTVQLQRVQVGVYLAQLKGIEEQVAIYRVQMDAARVQAEVERLKLEAFRSEVDAYTAQVQAKVAEFGMYRAQIEGETAKVQAFEIQVKAYGEQVQAAKVKADVQIAQLQFETERARANLLIYQGQMEQYKADTERRVAASRLQVEYYTSAVGEYRATNDKAVAEAQLQKEAYFSTVAANHEASKINVERARAKLEATVQALKFKISGTEFASDKINSQLTALASSINTLSVSTTTA